MDTCGVGNWLFCNPGAFALGKIWLQPCNGAKREFCVWYGETEAEEEAFRHHYSVNCSSVDCMVRQDREALNFSVMLTDSVTDLN